MGVFAHPDDEVAIAPVLGRLCRDLDGDCTLLVVTKGESGGDPKVREQEMKRSAEILGSRLIQWDLPNLGYPGDQLSVLKAWSGRSGSQEALIDRIKNVFLQLRPEILFLKDPRHGKTCHAEHMMISRFALTSLKASGLQPQVYFDETPSDQVSVRDPLQRYYVATQYSPTLQSDTWEFVRLTADAHASQLGYAVESYRLTPRLKRIVQLLELKHFKPDDPRYYRCK